MIETLRLGTRTSPLALKQTEAAVEMIKKLYNVNVELVKIVTGGDELVEIPLETTLDDGLFTKELDEALLKGEIDFAVHSMKDVPLKRPDGIILAGILPRDDPRDALIIRDDVLSSMKINRDAATMLSYLPSGSVVGTSSLRRWAQLTRMRKDIEFKIIRGNVGDRIAKLNDGTYDALVLSKIGLVRVGIDPDKVFRFDVDDLIPAAGQGVIGIEASIHNDKLMYVEFPNFEDDYYQLTAERKFIQAFCESYCSEGKYPPISAYSNVIGHQLTLRAFAYCAKTGNAVRDSISGKAYQASELGYLLAERMEAKLNA